jgi:hypothetical protein
MTLGSLAHSRTGDKGTIVNISVIAFDERDFDRLVSVVTAERVRDELGALVDGPVTRYLLPNIAAMNFVFSRPAGHSVTRTTALDPHGKSIGSLVLAMEMGSGP